ncbi:pre-mRNA-splicing factor 38B-like isoform X6 [Dermacentor andersoni]|uniref:pre-mRNA-splicing factor 38B-like isoform X6 n=1 Tax=Dermacentor andersoni TaxID=34620 RepID=UPI0024176BEF|nr:pre-mRNA-splicing factor 38B-like isoform X6 [Dermacentor andersoni]
MGQAELTSMAPGGPADKKNNVLPLWGNDKTMNLNNLILTNILSSPYFKVNLYKLKTYHEVVDEIYYNVQHLEPWEKGSRKTSGQTGMCGGRSSVHVRGVGAGGIVSTAFCILYKLFTLKLTRKQLVGLLNHCDSPYIRALGFMYIRFTQPPADLIDWYEPYLDDDEAKSKCSPISSSSSSSGDVARVGFFRLGHGKRALLNELKRRQVHPDGGGCAGQARQPCSKMVPGWLRPHTHTCLALEIGNWM